MKDKITKKGTIQFVLSLVLICLGYLYIFTSQKVPDPFAEGVMLGQGGIFVIWGLKEGLFSIFQKANKKEIEC